MFSDMAQDKSDHDNMYHIRLQGAVSSSKLDWSCDITIIPQGHGETLLVALIVDQAALSSFLDQFRSLDITVLPNECLESEIFQAIND